MSARKSKSSNVEVGTALRALEATFRAACREHGVPVHNPLVQQLQQCQEEGKPCVKVVFAGQSVGGRLISAVCGSLAAYAPVTSLSCLGCSIGDEGLSALSSLLKASAGKWWRGCRLATLEICSDGQQPATAQQQQQQQPPLPGNSPAALGLSRGSTMIPSRPSTAPGRLSSGQAHSQQTGSRCATDKSHASLLMQGLCPPVPAHLQFTSATRAQLAQQALSDRVGPVTRFQSRQPLGLAWQQQLVNSHNAAAVAAAAAGHAGCCSSRLAGGAAGGQRCESSCELGSDAWRGSSRQQLGKGRCHGFSLAVLQDFSLALSVSGGLVRLVLDHTQLGDAGMAVLAVAGLGECSSLKALSCCHCSIGCAGAKQLAAALTNASCAVNGSVAAGAGRPPDSRARSAPAVAAACPELQELLLSGNPLNGTGLQQLNPALRTMTSLKVLGLSDIGVNEGDKVQLQGLVHALTTGPAGLQVLEFDNHIGDRCAQHFLTLLEAQPSLVLLKLTARAAPATIASAAALMERNLRVAAHKPAKKKAAKQ